jgi:flagellar biosynthesis protein FliR
MFTIAAEISDPLGAIRVFFAKIVGFLNRVSPQLDPCRA